MALVLYGSGEFTDNTLDISRQLINNYKFSKIAILPTAATQEADWQKWFDMAKNHYLKFGITTINLAVVNQQDANNPAILESLSQADALFISGGKPDYLLKQLAGSLLFDKIKHLIDQSDFLVNTSSAGAMVMGRYIIMNFFKAIINAKDQANNWQQALGVVDYSIFPHFNRLKTSSRIFERIIKTSPQEVQRKWLGIDEDTALLVKPKLIKYGLGSVEISHNFVNRFL